MRGATDVNLEQIRAGFAWWYLEYAKQTAEDRASYESAQDDARTRRVGLWKDAKPAPPWEWRRKTKP
jgi:endonuclease YncB( thermonuclease family)